MRRTTRVLAGGLEPATRFGTRRAQRWHKHQQMCASALARLGRVDIPRDIVRRIGQLASMQDGLVTRSELLEHGLTRNHVEHHLSSGFLTPAVRGIYVCGPPALSHRQLLRCGLLLGGEHACLMERSAADVRGLLRPQPGSVTVGTSTGRARQTWTSIRVTGTRRFGLITVRSSSSHIARSFVGDFPAALVPRTLVDLAGRHDPKLFGWAWREAEFRGLLNVPALQHELALGPRKGAALVRRHLRYHQDVMTPATRLLGKDELPFLKLLAAHGIPAPEVNVWMWIAGVRYRADFYWRRYGLVVELDDSGHFTPAARDRDVMRDAEFFAHGLHVLRFVTPRVDAEPARCMGLVRAALNRAADSRGVARP